MLTGSPSPTIELEDGRNNLPVHTHYFQSNEICRNSTEFSTTECVLDAQSRVHQEIHNMQPKCEKFPSESTSDTYRLVLSQQIDCTDISQPQECHEIVREQGHSEQSAIIFNEPIETYHELIQKVEIDSVDLQTTPLREPTSKLGVPESTQTCSESSEIDLCLLS